MKKLIFVLLFISISFSGFSQEEIVLKGEANKTFVIKVPKGKYWIIRDMSDGVTLQIGKISILMFQSNLIILSDGLIIDSKLIPFVILSEKEFTYASNSDIQITIDEYLIKK